MTTASRRLSPFLGGLALRRRRGLMLLAVLWGVLSALSVVHGAEDADPPPEADDASTVDAPSAAADAPQSDDAAADKPSPEVFVPTEEISEDFAVPFPVDI